MPITVTATLYLPHLDRIEREADRTYPLETGGVLMGYWAHEALLYVTAVIGPGPTAKHRRWNFTADYHWQLERIAEQYESSGRRETYLGDWHTHPGARHGDLSAIDMCALRKVVLSPHARAPRAISAILFGDSRGWKLNLWLGEKAERRTFWQRINVSPLAVEIITEL